jgi:hypothetical protein
MVDVMVVLTRMETELDRRMVQAADHELRIREMERGL